MPPTTRPMTRNTQNNSTKNFSDQDSFQRTLDDNQLEATCTQITEKIGDQDRRVVIRAKWIRPQNLPIALFPAPLNQLYGYYSQFFIIRNTLIIRKYTYYSHNFGFWIFCLFYIRLKCHKLTICVGLMQEEPSIICKK